MPPTVTLALAAGEVPPEPVQVTEYVVLCDGVTVTEPALPDAVKLVPVQEVAFVEDQVRVDDWPEVIDVGDAESEAVGPGGGGGGGGGVTPPPDTERPLKVFLRIAELPKPSLIVPPLVLTPVIARLVAV